MSADEEDGDRLAQVLGNAVSYVANESRLLAQYDMVSDGKFARLWALDDPDDNASPFTERMNQVAQHLGGPPIVYVLRHGEKPLPADNFPDAALREAIDVFQRARKSVLRAHMFMTGSLLLREQPEILELPKDPDVATLFIDQAVKSFWEHAETAYIRLASFWDRVGQVLNFAFFNIRAFDRDGFASVMDRIAANVEPMNNQLKRSASWKRLRSYQTSEKEDGLKWLLRRRNYLVHSLHLRPIDTSDEDVFTSQFNHLDTAHREKMRPRDPADEAGLLVGQLDRAAKLFDDFLTVAVFSPERERPL